ncbi:2-oxoacid:acceptor oxidoreductase subunit alpha, partial [Clostridiaceae bacterium UIB06]|nr:2-oxoacid:acceptor oxidoreductase subunit alpha [Clostridiaceae bacterium UIB06]
TIWPFPEKQVKELAKKVKKIIVAELNHGQLVLEVERVVKGEADVTHIGKVDGEVFTPSEILAKIKEVI